MQLEMSLAVSSLYQMGEKAIPTGAIGQDINLPRAGACVKVDTVFL
jgi:hypothetical protein